MPLSPFSLSESGSFLTTSHFRAWEVDPLNLGVGTKSAELP